MTYSIYLYKRIISHAQNTSEPLRNQSQGHSYTPQWQTVVLFWYAYLCNGKFLPIKQQVDSLFLFRNVYYCFDGETWGKETTWKTTV